MQHVPSKTLLKPLAENPIVATNDDVIMILCIPLNLSAASNMEMVPFIAGWMSSFSMSGLIGMVNGVGDATCMM